VGAFFWELAIMFRWFVRVETAAETLERFGFDPETDWDDDPRIDGMRAKDARQVRAALRSFGRTAGYRRWLQARGKGPKGHGMGEDGRQQ
jgi:hypothetical protein